MKRRLDRELWDALRAAVWDRDGRRCVHCGAIVTLEKGHIDHQRQLSKGGSNHIDNLRCLCRRCHVLRAGFAHQGMIASALRDGVIPPDWRELVWEG